MGSRLVFLMLHRFTEQGLVCITQPHHAIIAGELARAWSNEQFGNFAPFDEVCLGASLHDIGWVKWEQKPTLNPETGYPHKFTQLPTQVHIDIWSSAKQLALPFGRYAALLVSLHGTGLYERFSNWRNSKEAKTIVQDFLNKEVAFQEQIINILNQDEYFAPYAAPSIIKRNQQLVATWDSLSIILCQGFTEKEEVTKVPTSDGETTLELTLLETKGNCNHIAVSPWPFQQSEVKLVYEGRLLPHTFDDEAAMQDYLNSNCWITLSTVLKPL
ncbi:DUF3891 family protein [Dulcicalothrix desertica]|nr:DUF3891 family protein [Dulcicalothrix desertica]TWH53957.1 uncharacterized protein DUF3891 [Dulcicalothrix desertica PCC 7102]